VCSSCSGEGELFPRELTRQNAVTQCSSLDRFQVRKAQKTYLRGWILPDGSLSKAGKHFILHEGKIVLRGTVTIDKGRYLASRGALPFKAGFVATSCPWFVKLLDPQN
jgi:hypothetical protein